jgi:hypothetical protein
VTVALKRAAADLLSREADLDGALVDRRDIYGWNYAWEQPSVIWASAICDEAERLGAVPLTADEVLAGHLLAASPVFVCGAPRSGTTLVRDLLDSHSALAVLPSEGKFFRLFADASTREQLIETETSRCLRNLANPNHQAPFWVLGRSSAGISPYVEFARSFAAWCAALDGHDTAACAQAAAALALTSRATLDISRLRHSVDKSPGYEFHLKWIWARWPKAKVIYLVRNPAEVAASYAAGLARSGIAGKPVGRMLMDVVHSHIATWIAKRYAPAGGLAVVEYAELVADREGTMERLCSFLGIEWEDCLLEQSIFGRAAEPNSSFNGASRTPLATSSWIDRAWLLAASLSARLLVGRPPRVSQLSQA